MSGALTITQALKDGHGVVFCPACGVLADVFKATRKPHPMIFLDEARCPRCWKAFWDIVEPAN